MSCRVVLFLDLCRSTYYPFVPSSGKLNHQDSKNVLSQSIPLRARSLSRHSIKFLCVLGRLPLDIIFLKWNGEGCVTWNVQLSSMFFVMVIYEITTHGQKYLPFSSTVLPLLLHFAHVFLCEHSPREG